MGLIFGLTLIHKRTFLSTLSPSEKHALSGPHELDCISTICSPLAGESFY